MLIRKKPDLHIHRSLKMVSTYTVIYPLIDFLDILWTTHLQPVNNTFIVQYLLLIPYIFLLEILPAECVLISPKMATLSSSSTFSSKKKSCALFHALCIHHTTYIHSFLSYQFYILHFIRLELRSGLRSKWPEFTLFPIFSPLRVKLNIKLIFLFHFLVQVLKIILFCQLIQM